MSSKKYLDQSGLGYFWSKILTALAGKSDINHDHDDKYYTESEIDEKLKDINKNEYSLPIATSDTLGGIKVGTNLSISNGVLSATNTTYSAATTELDGLMSAMDKTKLDGLSEEVAISSSQPVTDLWIDTSSTDIVPQYTFSTTDLTPGTSSLATGTLYFVYS